MCFTSQSTMFLYKSVYYVFYKSIYYVFYKSVYYVF